MEEMEIRRADGATELRFRLGPAVGADHLALIRGAVHKLQAALAGRGDVLDQAQRSDDPANLHLLLDRLLGHTPVTPAASSSSGVSKSPAAPGVYANISSVSRAPSERRRSSSGSACSTTTSNSSGASDVVVGALEKRLASTEARKWELEKSVVDLRRQLDVARDFRRESDQLLSRAVARTERAEDDAAEAKQELESFKNKLLDALALVQRKKEECRVLQAQLQRDPAPTPAARITELELREARDALLNEQERGRELAAELAAAQTASAKATAAFEARHTELVSTVRRHSANMAEMKAANAELRAQYNRHVATLRQEIADLSRRPKVGTPPDSPLVDESRHDHKLRLNLRNATLAFHTPTKH